MKHIMETMIMKRECGDKMKEFFSAQKIQAVQVVFHQLDLRDRHQNTEWIHCILP